jgi:hypothetical protein
MNIKLAARAFDFVVLRASSIEQSQGGTLHLLLKSNRNRAETPIPSPNEAVL